MTPMQRISILVLGAWMPLVLASQSSAQGVPSPLPETAELVAGDAATGELVGWSVSVDGATIVVGDWMTPGAAYVFVRASGTWTQQAKLVPIGATHDHGFGRAVAVSGDTLVVGAQGEDLGGGAFYVFERNGSTWDAGQRITIPGTAALGSAVAIEGDRMAIGALGDSGSLGAVFVFERTNGSWTQQQKLTASVAVGTERLGSSVALRGDRIIAGAPDYAFPTPSAGRACLFTFDAGLWRQTDVIRADVPVELEQFGAAVALDGHFVAVGAPAANAAPIGAAYVFSRVTGVWRQETRIVAPSGEFDDRFGSALALSGARLAVGAHIAAGGTGAGYVFERDAGLWPRRFDLAPTSLDGGSRLGLSVALSGRDLVVGAPYGSPAGSAFLFDVGPRATFTYCLAAPNVTGLPGLIGSSGSTSLAAADFVLHARNLPSDAFGLFLCGQERAQIAMATGTLCVSPFAPGIVRLGPVVQADATGFVSNPLDVEALLPFAVIAPGSTWHFQHWYRNAGPGGYDLTDGLGVTFEP